MIEMNGMGFRIINSNFKREFGGCSIYVQRTRN